MLKFNYNLFDTHKYLVINYINYVKNLYEYKYKDKCFAEENRINIKKAMF